MRTKRLFNLRSLVKDLKGHLCDGVRLGITWLVTLGIILEIGEQDCLALEIVVRLCIKCWYSSIRKLFGLQICLYIIPWVKRMVNQDLERIYSLYS
jgi:hypothetical protein